MRTARRSHPNLSRSTRAAATIARSFAVAVASSLTHRRAKHPKPQSLCGVRRMSVSREVSVRLVDAGGGIDYVLSGVVGDRVAFDNVAPGNYGIELEGRCGVQQTNCASEGKPFSRPSRALRVR